jgi:rare lipoprotein A
MKLKLILRASFLLSFALVVVGCVSQHSVVKDSAPSVNPQSLLSTPNAIPRVEPKSRNGNPLSYEVFGKTYHVMPSSNGFVQRGAASWYGTKFHGNKTSNGETYDMYAMTAAHKTLPIPTFVRVHNLENGKKIVVRVNDRGPFHEGRIIDLSYAAAAKLGVLRTGTSAVEILAINPRNNQTVTAIDQNQFALQALPSQTPITPIRTPQFNQTSNESIVYLQVGAFGSFNNADNLKRRLANNAVHNVRIQTENRHGGALHLVQIGPFASKEQAAPVRTELQQLNIFNTHFTQ